MYAPWKWLWTWWNHVRRFFIPNQWFFLYLRPNLGGFFWFGAFQDSLHMCEVWWTRCQQRRNQLQHLSKWCRRPSFLATSPLISGDVSNIMYQRYSNISDHPTFWDLQFRAFRYICWHISRCINAATAAKSGNTAWQQIASLAGEIPWNRGLRLWSILGSKTLQLGCEDEDSKAPRALVKGHLVARLGLGWVEICWDSWWLLKYLELSTSLGMPPSGHVRHRPIADRGGALQASVREDHGGCRCCGCGCCVGWTNGTFLECVRDA